jgi:hypothetical protein
MKTFPMKVLIISPACGAKIRVKKKRVKTRSLATTTNQNNTEKGIATLDLRPHGGLADG